MSVDPIQPGAPSTTGWNHYTYAGANPTTWADPTGQTAVVETATLTSSSVDRTVRTAAPVGVAVAQLFILAGGAYQAIECVDESFADAQGFGPGICGAIFSNDGDEPGPTPITPPSQYESWARDYGVSEDDIRNCEQNGPDSSFCKGLPPELLEILFNNAPTSALDDLAQSSGILRDAASGKGNFGIGSSTAARADELGQAWVGAGFRRSSSNPDILVSADGLRQYRPPSYKPNQGGYQANFEWRNVDGGRWQGNGHLDITDLATDLGR